MRKDKEIVATRIQVAFKKHLLRKQNKAATKIQALVRGHQARKKGARKAGGI